MMKKKPAKINRIKAVLEEQGRSQTWLTKKLGLTFPTVNGWCNNRNQPYLTDLVRTAELLEVAPADLIVDGTKKEKGLTKRQTFVNLV
ncbi:MAG: helix-turn-helix transcriptional regulator [Cyanothece sp. SIO1E1]|nr:helix-turn-helix transcriptional regulator [Cyanothece sp. SIO1E1]